MKRIFRIVMSSILASASIKAEDWKWTKYGLPKSDLKTCTPTTRGNADKWWLPYFEEKLKQPRKNLLFIGDSITDLWTYPANHKYPGGLNVWNKKYKDVATNFGITGDNTQNVLWRLTEGNSLYNYFPRHIVILIGINNLIQSDTPEDTFAGIKTIVELLRKMRPNAKIMLLGLFPCKEYPADPIREKIKIVNTNLKGLADYNEIYFADIGNVFLETDGSIRKEILRDFLHLSPKGYKIWADAMGPYLRAFLNEGGKNDIWVRREY
ncbi:MAG: GDSL-like protein lipase/acylhydrolase domain containing protein [Candidatus Uhrbacteria bacterium GW2011_GWF2_39_13]|uniref:GDSL-like protein lipase/acylhydrolase domain containing protein n=1 Tax=Candidatus Uhrbacteria bacterium GW2011_GWF2_39_13 TaxID=1618995 RepID=A0A0G0QPE5_9BACT|nr:MAG: GDSL-like protein lipase/acylhydrolase domain containing protein [Candidatus Uhrbacteria bacterium GW2011_GWF2_39_13]